MRALIVALVMVVSISASADDKKRKPPPPPEVVLVTGFFESTHAAPDKAVGQLAKSVKQAVALRSGGCLKKSKVGATVADDKTKKTFVKCIGEWAENANFSNWELKTLDDINPDGAKAFAKKLPKDAKIVMGQHSDGFIIVGLGAAKDGAQSIIAIYVDLSGAE